MHPEARTAAYKRHERHPGDVLVRLPSREWATVSKREALHSGMPLYKNRASLSIAMSMSYFKHLRMSQMKSQWANWNINESIEVSMSQLKSQWVSCSVSESVKVFGFMWTKVYEWQCVSWSVNESIGMSLSPPKCQGVYYNINEGWRR